MSDATLIARALLPWFVAVVLVVFTVWHHIEARRQLEATCHAWCVPVCAEYGVTR